MEYEEIRGLIHKNASEDPLEGCLVLGLVSESLKPSHYFLSLSLSITLGHLEFSWSTLVESKERKSK